MKRLLLLLAVLLSPLTLWAQHTTVTATVTDSNGSIYVNCTGSASFIGQSPTPGAGPYLLNGSVFQTSVPLNCNSSGQLQVSLADNNQISPSPSQWNFTICSASGYTAGPYCFNVLITITGATQTITSQLSAVAPLLPSIGVGGPPGSFVGSSQAHNSLGQFSGTSPAQANLLSGTGNGDIGDKINQGCSLSNAVHVTAGTYNYTTPIAAVSIPNVPCYIYGDNANSTVLNFTPSSGNAVTLAWGTLQAPSGIFGITLNCTHNTATGIAVGSASLGNPSAMNLVVAGMKVNGCAAAVNSVNGGAFNLSIDRSELISNTIGIAINDISEMVRITSSNVSRNAIGLNIAVGTTDVTSVGTSWDDNTTTAICWQGGTSSTCTGSITGNNSSFQSYGDHYENAGGGTASYWTTGSLSGNGPKLFIYGGEADDDCSGAATPQPSCTSTLAQFFNVSGMDTLDVEGLRLFSAGRTITNAISTSGSPNVTFRPTYLSSSFSADCTGCSGGRFQNFPIRNRTGAATTTWSFTRIPISTDQQITSTLSTGTAPLVVASTTNVANLNASSLSGATFASPGAIGGTTAAAGTFTALTATGVLTAAGGTSVDITGDLIQTGVAFASLPGSPTVGTMQFCTNCVPTTAATCSTNTPASCVCKSGTGSMWAKYENFVNNGNNWYCH